MAIVFITLKLCKVIDWSWWWVLSPIWIVFGFILLFLLICLLMAWLTRPKTPAEKAAAACEKLVEALRERHQ